MEQPRLFPKSILIIAWAISIAGCVSPAFRDSVGQFGQLTQATTARQTARLDAVIAAERERIRDGLAHDRALLFGVCGRGETESEDAEDNADPVSDEPAEAVSLRCRVTGAGGASLPAPATYENIRALNDALNSYSQALIALAADPTEDRQALTAGATALGASIGKLDAAITNADAGSPAAAAQQRRAARIGAVATLLGEVADLYLTARRGAILRRIIVRADTLIQQATELLIVADQSLYLIDTSPLMRELADAQGRVRDLARSNAPADQMRAAQDKVFEVTDRINALASAARTSQAVGRSHAALRRAAEAGASAADIQAAIAALVHLAGTVQATIEAFDEEEASDGGN